MNCGSSKEILIFFHLKNNDIAQNCVWRNVTEKIFKTDIITDMRKIEGTEKTIYYANTGARRSYFWHEVNVSKLHVSCCFLVKAVIKLEPSLAKSYSSYLQINSLATEEGEGQNVQSSFFWFIHKLIQTQVSNTTKDTLLRILHYL